MMIKKETMKTLTIEHLSAYLPYGLKFISGHYLVGLYGGGSDITRPILLSETMSGPIDWEANMDMDKPLLRPLSQLTETIEHNGERLVPIDRLHAEYEVDAELEFLSAIEDDWDAAPDRMKYAPMTIANILLSWHFNIFNLPVELFIPIPSIPQP